MRVRVNIDEIEELKYAELHCDECGAIETHRLTRTENEWECIACERVSEQPTPDEVVAIQVRVLTWDERKAHVLSVIEAMPGSAPTSGEDARLRAAGIEMRDAVARDSICGWSGMEDLRGKEIPFDADMIGRLEPYETIADDVLKRAMPGFDKKEITRAAAEAKAEGEDEKN